MPLCYIYYIHTYIRIIIYERDKIYETYILFDTLMEKMENINTPVNNTQKNTVTGDFRGKFFY